MSVHARDSASLIFCTLFYRNFDFKITSCHPVFLCFLVLHLPRMQSALHSLRDPPPLRICCTSIRSFALGCNPTPRPSISPRRDSACDPLLLSFILPVRSRHYYYYTTNMKEIAHVPVGGIGEGKDLPSFNDYTQKVEMTLVLSSLSYTQAECTTHRSM